MRQELDAINQFPKSTLIQESQDHKTDHALVGKYFLSTADFSEIKSYYDTELANKGWTYDYQEPIIFKGIDYGGKSVYYKKREYVFTLEYEGRQPGASCNYAIYTSWGLHNTSPIPLFIMGLIPGALGFFLLWSPETIQEWEEERRARSFLKLDFLASLYRSSIYKWFLRLVGAFLILLSIFVLISAILQSLKIVRV